jgi:penicillin-binding protein 1A
LRLIIEVLNRMAKPITALHTLKKKVRKEQRGHWSKIIKWSLCAVAFLMFSGAVATLGIFLYLSNGLPEISSLRDYHPPIITAVYSDDNQKIAEFYKERRIVVPLERIPGHLQQAFIAAEDSRFYKHCGVDFISIARAFFKNIKAGTIVQGGSTITQQVTKSFLLTSERSYKRKIREAILAFRIEKAFSKKDILYLYLNQIYLGHGAYGVQAASENYFGKSVDELNLAESAMLAGLPQAPSKYSPFHHLERARQRQFYVLTRMEGEGYITKAQAAEAMNAVLDIHPRRNWYLEQVPVYTENIRRYVENKYGEDALYTQGLKIYAAVNVNMQKAARSEIQKGLKALDRRQGYRGPIKKLKPGEIDDFSRELEKELVLQPLTPGAQTRGVVVDVNDKEGKVTVRMGGQQGVICIEQMRWARTPDPEVAQYQARLRRPGKALAVGDVILVEAKDQDPKTQTWSLELDQVPEVQAALVCMEAGTGLVKTMVGGRDFLQSQFNRAIQSRRQPGSVFKPVIYAAALDKGYTPATTILDSPIVFDDEEHDFTWKPKNYGRKFYGPTLLRDALAKSRNVVTIKILQDIGIDYAIDYARNLGVESDLNHDLSIALGSSGVSLLEIVRAYSVFADQGYLAQPAFITKIEDRFGNILEEMNPVRQKVIDSSTAYLVTSLLEGVVQFGTAQRVRALGRPVAGKTGTTNNLHDAWFVGYTPRFITGVWVGFDQERSLGKGETGSRAASPIWLGYMKKILENEPVRVFQVPKEVVFVNIDAKTGKLPIPESTKTIIECFKEGTAPTEYTADPHMVAEPDQFFKLAL